MYSSDSTEAIFQRRPLFSQPSQFKLKSWTDTIEGYLNEAKKLTTCIITNRHLLGRPYSWFLTIYIRQAMSAKDASDLWTKACRNLRRHGLVALWVREPTRHNRVHYHILIQSDIPKKDLEDILEKSMPCRAIIGWHKRIQANDDGIWLPFYITKAKIRGRVRGKQVADKYASKRLLFKVGLGLRKFGTIGNFWVQPKQAIWKEVRETEKRIAEGLADWQVRSLARHVFEFLGGHVSLTRIERAFGFWSDSPGIQSWIERLSSEKLLGTAR